MPKRLIIFGLVSLVGIGSVVLGGILAVSSVMDSFCGNTLVESLESPGGQVRAVLFERNCGATTGFSSQVSIIDVEDRLPDEPGNVFTADLGDSPSRPAPWGGPAVALAWRSEGVLEVRHDRTARVFLAEEQRAGVQIVYLPD